MAAQNIIQKRRIFIMQSTAQNTNFRSRLELKLLYLCSPLLKGIKPSCLITLSPQEASFLSGIFKQTGISLLRLSVTEERVVFLLYRKPMLDKLLRKRRHIFFLYKYGYRYFSTDAVLERLARRYFRYESGLQPFPHELGILLGYPLFDVLGYLRYHGKYSLLNGYWQVYHRPKTAKRKFRRYDRLRYLAVTEYKNGATMQEICSIK